MNPCLGRMYAAVYDVLAAREDQRATGDLRTLLVADAEGRVLELGTGTGRCLPHYRHAAQVVAVEPDDQMRARARRRSGEARVPTEVVPGDAMMLDFPDGSFDTVVAAWVLCTIPDPHRAAAEIRRVLRPGGTLRFCEHVRSNDPALAARQDRKARVWRWLARGCRCNQATLDILEAAGFAIDARAFDLEHVGPEIVRPTVLGVAASGRAAGTVDARAGR